MGKNNLSGSMDDLFGKRGTSSTPKNNAPESSDNTNTETTKKVNNSKTEITKRVEKSKKNQSGKKKILPDNFQKTNYILDPEVIKKFKAIAVLRGESVNLLANEVLGEYVNKNFNL